MTVVKGSGLDYLLNQMPTGLEENRDRNQVMVAASRVVDICRPYLNPIMWHAQHAASSPDEGELKVMRSRCMVAAQRVYPFIEGDKDRRKNIAGRSPYERSHGLFVELGRLLGLAEHELIAICERTS